jgi:ABC-type lipoprotein release transport system permease subunit
VTAIWLWVRRDARRRVRSLVVLAVLVAVAGGVVLAVTAGARRNGSVVDRGLALTRPADLLVLPNLPGFDWDAVRALPEVAIVGEFPVALLTIDGIPATGEPDGFPPASPEAAVEIERPIVEAGRLLDHSRVDEIAIGTNLAGTGIRVGDLVTVRLYAAADLERFVNGGGLPDRPGGPAQEATVVGVVKGSFFASGIQVTQAFAQRYAADLIGPGSYVNAVVKLHRGLADLPAFQQHIDTLAGQPVEVQNWHDTIKTVSNATDLESSSLYAFAAAAGAASVVLVGMALMRTVAASAGDGPLLRALGCTRREQLVTAVVAPLTATLVGVVAAVPLAWALSDRFPIGLGRDFEPTPGRQFDALVLVLGGLAMAVVVTAGCSMLARREVERTTAITAPNRVSRVGAALSRAGAPVSVTLGTRLALERGRGPAAVPVRPALVGSIVGVLGLVGALTFRDGLAHAIDDPALFGQSFDAMLEVPPVDPGIDVELYRPIVDDPDVAAVQDARNVVLTIDGRNVSVFSVRDLRGTIPLRPVEGRLPAADDEISLAPVEMRALGVAVGDTVRVGPDATPLRIVGETFTPALSHTPYDQGARLTEAGLRRFAPLDGDLKFHDLLLRFRPGVDAAATTERLSGLVPGAVLTPGAPVEDQENLARVRNVPAYLGAFLAVLATGAVGHALASAVRRRRHEVAVLRVLGLTRLQARASVAWQATTLAVVGVVVGIPLGIVVGRTVWRQVADATPMLYSAPLAALAVGLAGPAAIALANALAAWPGRVAARTRPAEVLRAE